MSSIIAAHPCPVCGLALSKQGTKLLCVHCDGVFVDGDELTQMIVEMTEDTPHVTWQHGEKGERTCPFCGVHLHSALLWGVPVDRCAVHGTWFDAEELDHVLSEAKGDQEAESGWQRFWQRIMPDDPPEMEGAPVPGGALGPQ